MKLGATFKCPYCKHEQEEEFERHKILHCKGCGKGYHGYLRIVGTSLPLMGEEL